MEEIKYKVLSLINEGMTLSMMSNLLHMTHHEIYQIIVALKINGFNIMEKIYANGEVRYQLIKSTKHRNSFRNTIITEPEEDELNLLIVSDLHLGSNQEEYQLIYEMIYYAMVNNIHIIVNTGDFIEGVINLHNINQPWDEQIEKALLKYPMVNNIVSFILFGNHDYSILKNYGQDIKTYIKNNRWDMMPLGYSRCNIKIKNDELILEHFIDDKRTIHEIDKNKIILRGHGHETKLRLDGVNYIINLPSLSNLNFNKYHFPGMLKLRLQFMKGNIINVIAENISYINHKMEVTGEYKIFTGKNKNYKQDTIIENEEYYINGFQKVKK